MTALLNEDALERRIREIAREEALAAKTNAGDDWIDQRRSPLGRKLHCQLVRDGVLPGGKLHRRVLVRRRDLDAYVEAHAATLRAPNDTSTEAAGFARVGARRVAR